MWRFANLLLQDGSCPPILAFCHVTLPILVYPWHMLTGRPARPEQLAASIPTVAATNATLEHPVYRDVLWYAP